MNAKYLLLNHFSQRYPKLPRIQPFDPASEQKRPIIALAFDLMTVPLKSFPAMETYNEAFQALFEEMAEAESDSEDDEDAPTKPAAKKNGKKPKEKQSKVSQPPADTKKSQSNRQRRRQERVEGGQTGRGFGLKRSPSADRGTNVGAKRPLPWSDSGADGMDQQGLKRSKSDTGEKLSVALDNIAPL
jgi:ribonuclease Z